MATEVAVYLALVVDKKHVTWHELGEAPTYFSGPLVSGRPVIGHTPHMTAQRIGDSCLLSWHDSTVPSPLPKKVSSSRLPHGSRFSFRSSDCVVWCQPAGTPWGTFSLCPVHVLSALRALTDAQRIAGAYQLLALPSAARQWQQEFAATTRFVQMLDGTVPKARDCNLVNAENGYELEWTAGLWNLFRDSWLPGRSATLKRALHGTDLVVLWDCATILADFPS